MKTSFGHPKPPKATTPVRVLAPSDLPSKGVHYSISHLRKLWKSDPSRFPVPQKLSPRKLVWPEHVIDEWIKSKLGADADAA
jgi:predicted DNA-binding transcriptional regulator AlpA